MRLLLAGDLHGNSSHTQKVFAHACRVDADVIFQLGDFGLGWSFSQRKGTGEKYDTFLYLVSRFAAFDTGIPFYWIGGNHENYDYLEELLGSLTPEYNGTYRVAPNVFFVPRGTKLLFGNKSFLCCGGGTSIDKKQRVPFVSWWPQEAITNEDVQKCADAGEADVLLSHDFPWECTVIDRHLDPYWGVEAQEQVIVSRNNISKIAGAAKVKQVYHGHLHISYQEDIEIEGGRVHVTGLHCDGTPLEMSTFLLDTETIN